MTDDQMTFADAFVDVVNRMSAGRKWHYLKRVPEDMVDEYVARGWGVATEDHDLDAGPNNVLLVWQGAGDPA